MSLCGHPIWRLRVLSESKSGAPTEGRPYNETLATAFSTPTRHEFLALYVLAASAGC